MIIHTHVYQNRSRAISSTFALLVGLACADQDLDDDPSSSFEPSAELEHTLSAAQLDDPSPVPDPLRYAVARAEAADEGIGGVFVDDDLRWYLTGEPEEVARYLEGTSRGEDLRAILIGTTLDQASCQGVVDELPELPSDLRHAERRPCDDEHPAWDVLIADELVAGAKPIAASSDILDPADVPVCAAVCGIDDPISFAGEQPQSNGTSTASENSCTTNGTYGPRYQCTEYVDRVHKRPDWTNHAYAGYWSSSSDGPWQKGLLPLASGNTISRPLAGDVIVWNVGLYGHVAIVAGVGASTLTVYDQNRACGSQSCTANYSVNGSTTTLTGGGCFPSAPVGYLRRGWDFSGAFGTTGWTLGDMSYVSSTTSGSNGDVSDYITLNPGATDPTFTSPTGIKVATGASGIGYNKIVVSIKSGCVNKIAKIYFKRVGDAGFSETRGVTATINGSDWNNALTFNMASNANWNGTIDQIRIDPGSSCANDNSDLVSLKYAYFTR